MIEVKMIMLVCGIPIGLVFHKVLMAIQKNMIILTYIVSQEDLMNGSKHRE